MMVRQWFWFYHLLIILSEICSSGLKINYSSLMPLMYITVLRFCFLSSNISFLFLLKSVIYFWLNLFFFSFYLLRFRHYKATVLFCFGLDGSVQQQ